MIAMVRKPLKPREVALLTVGAVGAVAAYCLGYSALAGRPESFATSLSWALINIAPWIPALELAKRARGFSGIAGALALGFAASLVLGLMAEPSASSAAFEAWRRVPALGAVAMLVIGLRWNDARGSRSGDPLPLLPRQIEWVQAAGNYVELRAGNRTIVHRTSISAAERDLAEHGFVRIHRSTLVRRDRIARVRPADVILHDGTHLPVGKRFRSQLSA